MFTKSSLTRCAAGALLAVAALAGTARAADEHLTGNILVVTDSGFTMQLRSGQPMLVTVNHETNGRLIAQHVRFSKQDLQHALEVKAAQGPIDQAIARNTGDIQQHGWTLDLHGTALEQHAGAIDRQRSELADHENRIVATTGAVASTNTRLSNLDEYNVIDSVTIYFANGSAKLPKGAMAELAAFAAKARGVTAYRLAIEGHASAVGTVPYNTVLSHLRAGAVTAALQQQGIPTVNIFVPAALGTTEQIADNQTPKGQAQNRRVVVTILQNKGLAQK